MKNTTFVITLIFLALLSLSLASILIPQVNFLRISPMELCVYYVATITVVGVLNSKYPI